MALLVFGCPHARGVYWNVFGSVLEGSKMLLMNYSLHEHLVTRLRANTAANHSF